MIEIAIQTSGAIETHNNQANNVKIIKLSGSFTAQNFHVKTIQINKINEIIGFHKNGIADKIAGEKKTANAEIHIAYQINQKTFKTNGEDKVVCCICCVSIKY